MDTHVKNALVYVINFFNNFYDIKFTENLKSPGWPIRPEFYTVLTLLKFK